MHLGVAILPKDKTVFGISFLEGTGSFNNDVAKPFFEIGIGIGVIALYFTFFKKGS